MNKRRNFSAAEKVKAVKRHLVDKETVSTICDSLNIGPNLFYKWQQQLFAGGEQAFSKKKTSDKANNQQISQLEKKINERETSLAELMTEHIKLKKKWNGDL